MALYRVSQEALQNIARHARARNVTVRLAQSPDELVLEITDDGVGFDPAQPFPGHLGLASMRKRMADIGGVLEPGQRSRATAPGSRFARRAGPDPYASAPPPACRWRGAPVGMGVRTYRGSEEVGSISGAWCVRIRSSLAWSTVAQSSVSTPPVSPEFGFQDQ